MKHLVKKGGKTPSPEDSGRNPTEIFKGEPRSNETHASSTDPDAHRLYKKSEGDRSRLCYLGHALMENRHSLAVDVETTLGADKGYDVAEFVAAMRAEKATPHVAQKAKVSAIDGRTTRHAGY